MNVKYDLSYATSCTAKRTLVSVKNKSWGLMSNGDYLKFPPQSCTFDANPFHRWLIPVANLISQICLGAVYVFHIDVYDFQKVHTIRSSSLL